MINVLFNSEVFRLQKFGGISRYFSELIKGINNAGLRTTPRKFYSKNKHLRANELTHFNSFADGGHFRGKRRIEAFLEKQEDKALLNKLKKGRFDVFHPTYYDPSFVHYMPAKKPFVMTVHDMIDELYFDAYFDDVTTVTKNKRALIPLASHIIAVSQNTKNDILRFFPGLDEKKVSVIHHGSSDLALKTGSRITLPSEYVLYVGNRGYYKNFEWFINAVAGGLRQRKIALVCAGGGVFTEHEQTLLAELSLSSQVHYVHIHDDRDLVSLYKGAACFIFPSLYEGFGIPILEAFSCGCPVILNNASCFPEIAGSAALYFEENNADSLVAQLNRVLDDPELSGNLKDAGFKRSKLFSWEKMVREHIQIYDTMGTA